MTILELYRRFGVVFSPELVILLAAFALAGSVAHATLQRNRRALWLGAGTAGYLSIQLWMYTAESLIIQREVAARMADVALLASIAVYNEQSWPWLSTLLTRGWKRLRGGG